MSPKFNVIKAESEPLIFSITQKILIKGVNVHTANLLYHMK